MNGVIISNNANSVDQIDYILDKVEKYGGTILKKRTMTSWGGYHGYFADPDGYCWVINYWDQWAYNEDGSIKI